MTDTTMAEKYVLLMADYAADGLWDADGILIDYGAVPISAELIRDIESWMDWFDRDCKAYLDNPPPFPYGEFAARGLELAKRIKAELPDWTVVYFDEAASIAGDGREPRIEILTPSSSS